MGRGAARRRSGLPDLRAPECRSRVNPRSEGPASSAGHSGGLGAAQTSLRSLRKRNCYAYRHYDRCARSFAVRPGPGWFGYASAARGLSCGLRAVWRAAVERREASAQASIARVAPRQRCGNRFDAPPGAPPPLGFVRGRKGRDGVPGAANNTGGGALAWRLRTQRHMPDAPTGLRPGTILPMQGITDAGRTSFRKTR